MKIDRLTLLAGPSSSSADLLYQAGKDLRGTNLKRSSWLLIANALQVQRVAEILLQRMEAATTRQDALRVLRIARKAVPPRRASSRGAPRPLPQVNLLAVAADTSQQAFKEYEDELRYDQMLEEEILDAGNFSEWLAEQENTDPVKRSRLPGLLPVSAVQDLIDRYAWEHRQVENLSRQDLRSQLDDETYQRLLALTRRETGLEILPEEREFLEQHGLQDLLDYVNFPALDRPPILVRDGAGMVGVQMIEERTGGKGHPFQVDWKSVEAWLVDRLGKKPEQDASAVVIPAAYRFFHGAPAPLLTGFLQQSRHWHRGWTSLLWYAYPRIGELLPHRPVSRKEPGWWGASGAYVNETRWERLLDAGTGSRLVLHNLMKNVEDLFYEKARVKDQHWNAVCRLMLAGGGTLRRMDYPDFTVVCRPTITMVRLDTFVELVKLADRLVHLNSDLIQLTCNRLVNWIANEYASQTAVPLPEGLNLVIAGVLERHAAAYLMLKERVLREAFQSAPFRIRRKHIQRFWADQEAGLLETGKEPFPMDFQSLREVFGSEALKEALVHALLDHFKDEWNVSEEAAQPLKEALLGILRSTALIFNISTPQWVLYHGFEITEDDLENVQNVVSFLVQQTENAPLEMARALLLDPGQGLPRLAGGRLTTLEQTCRHLVKEIAGVSQKKVVEAEARIFTCRPISKGMALGRGNLGGDCSSDSVPMRALSPHHTYYGIFENGEQQRGYITVYEAGAEILAGQGPGDHIPVLCLETINVPIRVFDAVQQDLLLILEAVANSRGLAGGLVLITGIGTWNYQNGEVLRQSRRFRQGKPVRLYPADPASWNVYCLLAPEGETYTTFFDDQAARHYSPNFRLLAPFQPEVDAVEPENIVEAQRIASLPPRQLRITVQGEKGPAGFISALPEIL